MTQWQSLADRFLQRLKSALWFSIGKIVDEETIKLGVNATPQFIGALTEMVWAQIGTLPDHLILSRFLSREDKTLTRAASTESTSRDVESFAKYDMPVLEEFQYS